MDKECKRQVNELNILWHQLIIESNYKDIEVKYPNMQGLSTNELSIIRIISEKKKLL